MSRKKGYDVNKNTPVKRISGSVKIEYFLIKLENLVKGRRLIEESIPLYNEKRSHNC